MDEMPRSAGVLLHITSLPSKFGIGDLGPAATGLIDRAAEAGLSYWQVLPLHPTVLRLGCSPYHSPSAFAGNTQLISPELVFRRGWLNQTDLKTCPDFPSQGVDYARVFSWKQRIFERAFQRFLNSSPPQEFENFCQAQAAWLDDYALFRALQEKFPRSSWQKWPKPLRDRDPQALSKIGLEFESAVLKTKFLQYLFFQQWTELRSYAQKKGIGLIGDLPIYVTYESSDVWNEPDIFQLDANKRSTHIAGVPPDYFSSTGQLWRNPLYRWDVLAEQDYSWWVKRFQHALSLFDLVRIDHFRGFVGYWQVPAGHKTAKRGRWVDAPAVEFFGCLQRNFPELPFIAEDLGTITDDVVAVMERYRLPGMKVMLFAFGEEDPDHPYLPSNYPQHCVAYTGTHDNNTVRGWFENEAGAEVRERVFRYLGRDVAKQDISWEFIQRVMDSPANLTVIPMQDFLGLGQAARMNRPARKQGNWLWRMSPNGFTSGLAEKINGTVWAASRAQSRLT